VHDALGDARTVLNVGAGAGSYEPLDRIVTAVEPSAAMRAQRPAHLSRQSMRPPRTCRSPTTLIPPQLAQAGHRYRSLMTVTVASRLEAVVGERQVLGGRIDCLDQVRRALSAHRRRRLDCGHDSIERLVGTSHLLRRQHRARVTERVVHSAAIRGSVRRLSPRNRRRQLVVEVASNLRAAPSQPLVARNSRYRGHT